jgi:hypothetical protein
MQWQTPRIPHKRCEASEVWRAFWLLSLLTIYSACDPQTCDCSSCGKSSEWDGRQTGQNQVFDGLPVTRPECAAQPVFTRPARLSYRSGLWQSTRSSRPDTASLCRSGKLAYDLVSSLERDPLLKERLRRLRTVPGVGSITALCDAAKAFGK